MEKPSKRLLDQVRDEIRLKHYSIRTETAYVDWITRYILFNDKRHPKDMGRAEIPAFLTHLAVDLHVASSTQNQALSAVLFLYRDVLEIEVEGPLDLVRANSPPTGALPTRALEALIAITRMKAHCKGPSAKQHDGLTSTSRSVATRSGTALPRTGSNPVTTFARCRNSSATKT